MGESCMIKIKKDMSKNTAEEIEKKPGRLAAQIVWNTLVDNDMFLWLIGNTNGNRLFTVSLNNGKDGIVGFTDINLTSSYVNRKDIKKNLLGSFGKKIICINMSFKNLLRILTTQTFVGKPTPSINTAILNPNNRDFFIPMDITHCAKLIDQNIENIGRDLTDVEFISFKYDNKEKLYLEDEQDVFVEDENDAGDFV